MCRQWAYDQLFSPLLSNVVTALIVVINYILRLAMIMLIKQVGQKTETNQTKSIKTVSLFLKRPLQGIFVVQFLNTAVLLLLVNASLKQSGLNVGLKGQYIDFTAAWYDDIGASLTQTMLINAFFPVVEFLIFVSAP